MADNTTTKTFVGTPIGTSQPKAPEQPKVGLLERAGKSIGGAVTSAVDPAFALGVANAIGQGVTFGTADEAIAALASAAGYDYKTVRDAIRQNLNEFRDENTAIAYGTEIAASFLTPAGAARSAAKLSGQGIKALARNIAQYAKANPIKAGAVGSAIYGAGAAQELGDVPAASLTGAAIGAGSQALAPVAQKIPQALERAGIPLTIGQMMGRGTKRLEEGMQSLPVVGTSIRGARERAMEKFSPYIFNRAFRPLGIKIPMGLSPRGTFNRARAEFNKRYDKILSDVDIEVSDDFLDELSSAVSKAKTELGEVGAKEAADLENFVMREVLGSVKDGRLSGEALKRVQSELGKKQFQSVRKNEFGLADAFGEVDTALMNIFTKYSPAKRAELQKLDKAYANYVPLRRAAAQADESMFTPARALQAVRAEERRAGATGLGRLAAGEARMQRPIEVAKRTIGAELGDSGTAERFGGMLMPIAATSGVGALGGMAAGSTDLGALGGLGLGLAALGGGKLAYTPAGQTALKRFIVPAYSGTLRSPATAGLLAQSPSDTMQTLLLGE